MWHSYSGKLGTHTLSGQGYSVPAVKQRGEGREEGRGGEGRGEWRGEGSGGGERGGRGEGSGDRMRTGRAYKSMHSSLVVHGPAHAPGVTTPSTTEQEGQ